MSRICRAIAVSAVFALCVVDVATAASEESKSVEAQLEKDGSGVGRFRGGWYVQGGWARSNTKINGGAIGNAGMNGLLVEGGAYGLFNPIRDFADIEAGIGLKMVTTSSSSNNGGATTHDHGYYAATVYAGPVFRVGNSGSSIGFGPLVEFANKLAADSNDPLFKNYGAKMTTSFGAYGEYQYAKPGSKQIYFTRLTYTKYDLEFDSTTPAAIASQGKGQSALSLSAGIKF